MRHIIVIAALLPLAACNKGPTVTAKNASAAEVAAKVSAAGGGMDMMSPGRWEGTLTIHDMKMPGMPAAAQAQLAAKMGRGEPIVSCVTPEEVKARKAFFTGDEMKSCTYEHYTMAGGTLDAKVTCNNESGKMSATMKGSYTADSFKMDMAQQMASDDKDNPMGSMSSVISIATKRVGACRGDEDRSKN